MANQGSDPEQHSRNVARLAAEVERLGREIASLTVRVDGLASDAASNDPDAFEELRSEIEAVARQLEAPASPSGLPPVAWLDVTVEQAPVVLAELSEWIGTVLVQYDLDGGIVPCWYRHPDAVQVLLDLRVAWLTTYRNPEGGKVLGALDWHQRFLPAARQYLKGLKSKCSDREHEMRRTSFVVDDEAMRVFAQWWGSGRAREDEPAWVPPGRARR